MPLIMIMGLPGTGKTSLAEELSRSLTNNPIYLSTDLVRRHLFDFSHHQYEPFGSKLYTEEKRDLVYNALYLIVEIVLKHKHSIILDGTFYSQSKRQPLYNICKRLNQKPIIISTVCSEETVKQRIEDRKRTGGNTSDADFNIYLEIKKRFEVINHPHMIVDTEEGIPSILQDVKSYIENF